MSRRLISMLAALVLLASLAMFGSSSAVGHNGGHNDGLRAKLLGANEVPAADPDGDGRARFKVRVSKGEVCFRVSFDDITTANRGHIHKQVAGANGPIVVPLFDLEEVADRPDPRLDVLEKHDGLWGCVEVDDAALLTDIKANPGSYYCNLHNSRFPGGAIRGQLEEHDDD